MAATINGSDIEISAKEWSLADILDRFYSGFLVYNNGYYEIEDTPPRLRDKQKVITGRCVDDGTIMTLWYMNTIDKFRIVSGTGTGNIYISELF